MLLVTNNQQFQSPKGTEKMGQRRPDNGCKRRNRYIAIGEKSDRQHKKATKRQGYPTSWQKTTHIMWPCIIVIVTAYINTAGHVVSRTFHQGPSCCQIFPNFSPTFISLDCKSPEAVDCHCGCFH